MSLVKTFLTYIGVRVAGVDETTLNKGKRRTVTYLAFVCFVLLAAATDDEEWVKGGIQYAARRRMLAPHGDGAAALAADALEGDGSLGAPAPVNSQFFAVGLTSATVSGNWYSFNSGKSFPRACTSPIGPYIRNWNAGIGPGSQTRWANAKPIKVDTFQDTLGLMGFATATQGVAWILMAAIQYEAPYISTQKSAIFAVRILMFASNFFAFLGVVVFGSSPIKDEFCQSANPNRTWQSGLGCGFGEAFQTAIAAIVLIAFNSALAWLWMPTEIGQDYAFSESAGGISGGAVPEKPSLFSGSAYSAPVERPVLDESLVAKKADSAFSGSSFQDADL